MRSRVKLKVSGVNLDKLLQKINENAKIYNIYRPNHKTIFLELNIRDYDEQKNVLKQYYAEKIDYSGWKKCGILFRKYLACILCIPLLVCGYFVTNSFIWKIRIYGVDESISSNITQILREENIYAGSTRKCDNKSIENILLNKIDRLSQVSVIRQGNTIVINASEKLTYTPTEYRPIVAEYDGVITSVDIATGTTNIKVGDFVKKGDVLVSPYTKGANGQIVNVKPMADIKAEVYISAYDSVKKTEQELVRSGNSYKICVYGLKNKKLFATKAKKHFDYYDEKVYTNYVLTSTFLPITQTTIIRYELVLRDVEHDLEKEQNTLENNVKLSAQNMAKNCEKILDTYIFSEIKGDVLYATCTLTCSMQMCKYD